MRHLALATIITAAGLGHAAPAGAWSKDRSHQSDQQGKGICHAAVDEIVPAGLRPFFHRVVRRESGDDPGATYRNTNGSIDRGCMQVNSIHGISAECLLNARCNIRFALRLYMRDGSSPWRASSGGVR
jgi:hypothetical protein